MNKVLKILAGLLVLAVVIAAGLAVFVRFYLTEERLKALIIPPTEQALGRKVTLGAVNVGLFRGITLKDLVIKEADGVKDFVRARAFILNYDLLPLLQKKLLVSELLLLEPEVAVSRDANGNFNFAALPFLARKDGPPPAGGAGRAAALPLALTIDRVRLEKAKLSFRDAQNELPAVDATADLTVGVNLSPAAVDYRGELTFEADLVQGKLAPHIEGKSSFDTRDITLLADVTLDQEELHLDGLVENYAASPKGRLDMKSELLNVDHLLALVAGVPAAAKEAGQPQAAGKTQSHPDLAGTIKVAKAVYRNLEVTDFLLNYTLKDGIFTIPGLAGAVAGGRIKGDRLAIDLTRPEPGYAGTLTGNDLQLAEIVKAFAPETPEIMGGKVATTLNFKGSGTTWPEIQKTLTADGTYTLKESWLRNTELTRAVATLVGLPELENLTFQEADGSLEVANGRAKLASTFNGEQLALETRGDLGLDGGLNLPVTLKLSPALSEKLRTRVKVAKYLADESGATVLKLTVTGTIKQPRPALDPVAVREQTEKVLQEKVQRELNRFLERKEGDSQNPDPARELLRGLFGK